MNLLKAEFEMAAGLVDQLPVCDMPEIVFAGRSNVGKSSLINKLVNRKSLARVSSQPGKTATINFYNVVDARLVDLPGYGFAKVSRDEKNRWSQLIDGYFAQGRDIKLAILLVDSRHKPSADDLVMLDYLAETELPTLIVLTKIDKLKPTERKKRMELFPEELGVPEDAFLPVSAETGEGIEELKEILAQVTEE